MTEEIDMIMAETKETMNGSIEHFANELAKIRAGKASPSMVNGIRVDYYGADTPINQLANISTPDPKTLSIQPFDKASLQDIEKAIFAANLGLTPQNDGEFIRINIPPLTEERRKQMVKQAKGEAEKCRISLRNARKQSLDMLKDLKDEGLSEDIAKDTEAVIQKVTNEFADKVNALTNAKEKEIMTV